jgi:uncharacterized protein YecE (DUF72 family)
MPQIGSYDPDEPSWRAGRLWESDRDATTIQPVGKLWVGTSEFRDPGWFEDETHAIARTHGAAVVVTDQEDWPRAPRVETAPFTYYRLRREYSDAELMAWSGELRSELLARSEVHVFLRHAVAAPRRALALRAALVSAPA